jgi:hypothetical protein
MTDDELATLAISIRWYIGLAAGATGVCAGALTSSAVVGVAAGAAAVGVLGAFVNTATAVCGRLERSLERRNADIRQDYPPNQL